MISVIAKNGNIFTRRLFNLLVKLMTKASLKTKQISLMTTAVLLQLNNLKNHY